MSDRSRYILVGTFIGALIGLGIALVAAESAEDRQRLVEEGGDGVIARRPFRDWIKFGVAAVMLVRQFADMMAPKSKK